MPPVNEGEKSQMTRVTVVTVSHNAEREIRRTIQSVLEQDYLDLEYIVMDGNSSDKTMEIVRNFSSAFHEKKIPFAFFSEKDNGIFDAMNKSLTKTESDYVLFLNAGDYFVDRGTIASVFLNSVYHGADVIYGDYYVYAKHKRKLVISDSADCLPKKMMCTHQAIFTKVSALKARPFNTDYQMAADYDWYLEMYNRKCRFVKADVPIVYFGIDGISQRKAKRTQTERFEVQNKHHCISESAYKKRKGTIRKICFRKNLIRLLPGFIRYFGYEDFS